MADLLISFGFDQTSKTDAYSTLAKQLYPNKNQVICTLILPLKLVFSDPWDIPTIEYFNFWPRF